MSNQHTAIMYDFRQYKESRIPTEAKCFCDGLSLLQSILKLTNRISDQYDQSIAIECEIDENAADVTEHIVGVIRDTYKIPTDEIHHHLQATFNIRDNLPITTHHLSLA